ncbi:MAG: hypothetical protein LBG52_02780 [Candidatus Peribacteria bacterium]|jgi:hypothetical protein|nr:hypothetical protein [Candidatus Peribacteria bacterium]
MTAKTSTSTSKQIFFILLLIIIGAIGWYAYLRTNTTITKRLIAIDQKKVAEVQKEIEAFSEIPGFDKVQLVQKLEHTQTQMPRSEHIKAVLEILQEINEVDSTSVQSIVLSDFKISLEEISLHGYVPNLRILYFAPETSKQIALIERFKKLDFLDDIKIQTYNKSADNLGYDFVLTAKVINNDTK